ncbi:nuclear transport factor 2 family protein [Streptomyces acidiscabies]|uniref:Nuclear transport factor 2 family protein n=1 Tax=Streptomyces acidiscabies TaxID=42234 RepID=A0A0L0KIA1_9ACTN|nr:nuclear transport factor 2 family protein [Streptomyces acidiscabies]MBP5934777.1 nuclear transport factor 2 family protein [Streptomyces sp. LBUM 1476]KND37360.1 polyketide cyclase [Streptomyces acidiscabies]MBZ3917480.1 nuclear transport factor 2 family protein [Streptomyces acidiscabies]MDX2963561.1 nuclear transport factor 2 family protein [Streptomyces acidiscabies]MDX3018858.1 nuclear transport factor 2 family protein [Streptomyces acidiscabies]
MSTHTERHDNAVTRYFEAWNARDPEARAKAVAAAWTETGSYTDPLADVSGHAGITAVIAAAHEQFPGFAFRPTGTVDGHHDTARFSWELVNEADSSAPVAGSDVVTLDEDGRIVSVLGFLDRVPDGV